MKNLKENVDLFLVIFAFLLCILLFFSSFIQIPILIHAGTYEREIAPIEQLTEKEYEEICFGDPCDYSHKIIFDNHPIKVVHSGFHFTNKVWVYYKTIDSKKVYVDRSDFLFLYIAFDLFSFGFITFVIFYMKQEKKKESSKHKKKIEAFIKRSEKQNSEPESEKSLPPFGTVFLLGYFQFAICFLFSYSVAKYFPGDEWISLISFLIPFLTGILLYSIANKSIAFLLSSILCLAPSAIGKEIVYLENLLHPSSHPQQENVYTLDKGKLNRKFIGANTIIVSSGSKKKSRTYDYHFVAPYQTESSSFTQWILLKTEWLEDETKFAIFWNDWEKKRLAVQIFDEDSLYAITKAGNKYHLDLSNGVSLLKPILSLEAEIESSFWHVFWTLGIALSIWTIIGCLRIYASKE